MSEEPKPEKTTRKEGLPISSAPRLKSKSLTKKNRTKVGAGIPKKVANRMARRVAFTTGMPTMLGMGIFIGSYVLVSKGITDIAPGITLLTSAICFLIGLGGLSYGILSASWDELPGSIFGLENINTNIERIRSAFKSQD